VLFECLDFTTREEAVYRINQAALRLHQATSRVQTMGYTSLFEPQMNSATGALSDAETSFSASDYETAITNAMSAESQSTAVLSVSWSSKISEEITIRFGFFIVGFGIACSVIVFSGGGRGRLRSLFEERLSLALTFSSSILYLALIPLITSLTDWQFSASYIAAYLYNFFFLVSATTLVSFLIAFVSLLVLSKGITRDGRRLNLLKTLKRFLAISVIVYFLAIFTFIGFNRLGLPWYATDVAVPLMYFFILLTGIIFVVYAIISVVIIQRLQYKIVAKDIQDGVE
jgi:hypothetical protein